MKRITNGFTLVELIITITLLVLITGIFSINMIVNLNKQKEREDINIVNQIYSAADAFVSTNPERVEQLNKGTGFVEIEIGELRDSGLLSEELSDAETGKRIPDEDIVRVRVNSGGEYNFEYPVVKDSIESLHLVAKDLYILYNDSGSDWCSNENNLYTGLYTVDSDDTSLYLEKSNGNIYGYGTINYSDYFDVSTINLKADECNVNPKKVGTYNITYSYHDTEMNIDRKANRTVYVTENKSDVLSFTANFVNKRIVRTTPHNEVMLRIVENRRDEPESFVIITSVSDLEKNGYTITNFQTDTVTNYSVYAIVSRIKYNSDGSLPAPQRAEYEITPDVYNINLDANEGRFSDGSTHKEKTVTYRKPYGDMETPSRIGHTFNDWFTNKNGTGTKITESSKVTIPEAHILYAGWTVNKYDVNIINNNSYGTVNKSSMKIEYGGTGTFTVTPKRGYQVSGVSCTNGYSASGYSSSTETQTITVSNNKRVVESTCTVSYSKRRYSVTIYAGSGGQANPSSIMVPFDGSNSFTVTPNPGYTLSDISCGEGYIPSYRANNKYTQSVTVRNLNMAASSSCSARFSFDNNLSIPLNKLTKKMSTISTSIESNINLMIILDLSGSMNSENRLGKAKNVINHIIDNLNRNSTVSVITHTSHATVRASYLTNKNEVKNIVNDFYASGPENYEAGVVSAVNLLANKPNNYNTYTLFISDATFANDGSVYIYEGNPNLSRLKSRSTIYTVSIGYPDYSMKSLMQNVIATRSSNYFIYQDSESINSFYNIFDDISKDISRIENVTTITTSTSYASPSNGIINLGSMVLSSSYPLEVYLGSSRKSVYYSVNNYLSRSGSTYYFNIKRYLDDYGSFYRITNSNLSNLSLKFYKSVS